MHASGTDLDVECNGGVCDGAGTCALGGFTWGQRFGDGGNQWAKSVATLSMGDVVLGGRAPGTVNFGTGALTTGEIFVARFEPGGQGAWAFKWGDGSTASVTDIAVDGGDNIYVTARTAGSVTIGGTTITDGNPETFDPGVGFIFKLNASGSESWAREFNDGQEISDAKLAVSDNGEAYLAGYYQGAPQVAGGPTLPNSGTYGIFFARLSTTGAHVWSIGYASTNPIAKIDDVAATLTSTGDVAFVANFGSGVDIGGQTAVNDSVVVFDTNGNPVSATPIGAVCGPRGLHTTPGGDMVVPCANGKIFSISGATVTQLYEPPLMGSGTSVQASAIDAGGNILMLGRLVGDSNFGGDVLVNAGGDDVLLAKIGGDGTHLWSYRYGDSGNQCQLSFPNECGRDIAADLDGNVLVGGALQGAVSFGGPDLVVNGTLDAFLVKLTP